MKFSAVLAALSASMAVAAPAPVPEAVSMMAAAPLWTIESMSRNCNSANNQCDWNFKINANNGKAATACKLTVKGNKASEANGGPANCGDYTVTSGWSGQFGAGNGFTTLAVVNNQNRQIVWPAYTDKQVAGGNVVKPDQAYAPVALP